jgi:hypothetical protein
LKQEVLSRGIRRLVHFTYADNLESIFQNGILPINMLVERDLDYYYNDELRMDGQTNASCLSIHRPNYSMFWKYRSEYPGSDWVVLGIKKEVLWEKDCAFCVENAASNNVRYIPTYQRKGVDAFKRLFEEYPEKPRRNELGLSDYFTTHPQAEVLIFDKIEPSYIFGVAFENHSTMNKYQELIPNGKKVEVQKWLYGPRQDYAHWRK